MKQPLVTSPKQKQALTVVLLLLALTSLPMETKTDQICPTLSCDATIGEGVCFDHSGDSPVTEIQTYRCHSNQWCYLQGNQFAWVNAHKQSSPSARVRSESQVHGKYTQKQCEEVENFRQELNNARDCETSAQCLSRDCDSKTKKCVGMKEGEACSDHYQCDAKLSCNVQKVWPYATTCEAQRDTGESCRNDFECQYTDFCGPQTVEDAQNGSKTCISIYSQENGKKFGRIVSSSQTNFQDRLNIGRYCRSGVAFPLDNNEAVCVDIQSIRTNYDDYESDIQAPYNCSLSPTTNDACRYNYIYYEEDGSAVTGQLMESYCECSFRSDSPDTGICQYPGQSQITAFVESRKALLEKSECHTLDWNDMMAQKECGAGASDDEDTYNIWVRAVQTNFNMTYWPSIQQQRTYDCLDEVMAISLKNLQKAGATTLGQGVAIIFIFLQIM